MEYRGSIGISTMLADIRSKPEETFTLEWWRAANEHNLRKNKAGTVKLVAKAVMGAPKRMNAMRTKSTKAKGHRTYANKADFRDTSQFPITDSESGQFLTPLLSHLKSYNGLKIIH